MIHLLFKMDKLAMLASLIVICVSQSTRWGICGKWVPDIDKIKKSEKCKKATISDAVITTVCCLCCWFIAPKLGPTALAGAAAGMAADRAMNYVPMPNY